VRRKGPLHVKVFGALAACAFLTALLGFIRWRLWRNLVVYKGTNNTAAHVLSCAREIVWHGSLMLMVARVDTYLKRNNYWRPHIGTASSMLSYVAQYSSIRAMLLSLVTWDMKATILPKPSEGYLRWACARYPTELMELIFVLVYAAHISCAWWHTDGSYGSPTAQPSALSTWGQAGAAQPALPEEQAPIVFDENLLALAEGQQVLYISHDLSLRWGPLQEEMPFYGMPVKVSIPDGIYRVRR